MWDFQLRFSSRVTPRNLASLTCFIATLLIFRQIRVRDNIFVRLKVNEATFRHVDMEFVHILSFNNSALLLIFGRPLI